MRPGGGRPDCGLRVRRLDLVGGTPGLGERFAAALDEHLARRGLQHVEVGHLQLDARGLAAGDLAGLQRLAGEVAAQVVARAGGGEATPGVAP